MLLLSRPTTFLLPSAVAVLLIAIPVVAQAAALTVSADRDSFVSSGEPATVFGNKGAVMIAAPTAAQPRTQWGLVGFDAAALKAGFDALYGAGGWKVTGLSLSLESHHYLEGEQAPNLSLNRIASGQFGFSWMADDSWSQGSTTWNTLATGSLESLGSYAWNALPGAEPSGIHASSWALAPTAGIVADILSGSRVSILGQPLDDKVSFEFNQLKAPDHLPAVLVVAAAPVPEPEAAGLMVVGILSLLARRRPRGVHSTQGGSHYA